MSEPTVQSKAIELSRERFNTLETLMIERGRLQNEFNRAVKVLDAQIVAERCSLSVALTLTNQ